MVYDTTAKKVGVKAIATVESNNDYGAINYNDPITVGVVQWFGTRAANLLMQMKVSGTWTGVAPSLDNNLNTVDRNSPWWTSRYLTSAEGASLVPNLTANDDIQNQQIVADFEGYKDVAISYGFDPEANTNTVLFFFTMHHQSPASALRVVQTIQTDATLEQIRNAALADPTLGQYPGRQNTAYDIILAHDPSGIEFPGETGEPEPPVEPPPVVGGGGEPGSATELNNLVYAESVGSTILLHFKDSKPVTLYAATGQRFIPAGGTVTPVEPTPPVDPVPPVDPPPDPPAGSWWHPLPSGIITSPYGPRGWDGVGYFHYGTDWSTPGSAGWVHAVTDMVITFAGEGNASAGTHIKAQSVDGLYSFNYFHMVYGSLRVRTGDTVTVGTPIGIEGATGNVTGRHLHFEIYEGALVDPWPPPYGPMPIDPVPFLTDKGAM